MAYNPQNANGQATMANSSPVVIASNQSTLNIADVNANSNGQKTMANSSPVVLASDQSTLNVSVVTATPTYLRFYATAVAAGTSTTETAITLTKSSGTSATSTAASHTPTNGKKFKIIYLSFATRGHNTATAQTTTFNFRVNTAGAVGTTTTPIILAMRCATPATANAWDRVIMPLEEPGIELTGDGTLQWGITAAATYTTNAPTWDVTIVGYEY